VANYPRVDGQDRRGNSARVRGSDQRQNHDPPVAMPSRVELVFPSAGGDRRRLFTRPLSRIASAPGVLNAVATLEGAVLNSRHPRAKALDIHLPDVDNDMVAVAALGWLMFRSSQMIQSTLVRAVGAVVSSRLSINQLSTSEH
jgi:hypothetical protein